MPPNGPPTPRTSSRLRSNLRFGAKLYRRLSSLRPRASNSTQPEPISSPNIHKRIEYNPTGSNRQRDLSLNPDNENSTAQPSSASHIPVEFYLRDDGTPSSSSSLPRSMMTRAITDLTDQRRQPRRTAQVERTPSSLTAGTATPSASSSIGSSAYALDSSPVEEYESRNVRAERVATALERIAKQTSYFEENEDGMDDDVTPKEAIIPLIIESMEQHVKDPKVVDRALTTLRRLTVSETCRRKIGECGGVEAIVEIMKVHSLRVRIQTQACLALANLAYRCPDNKEAFMRCGGLKVVVAALSIHKQVEHVQAWGCLAIRNYTNGAVDLEEEDAAAAFSAVEVLVSALEHYPKSEVVQQQSMIALTNIASSSKFGMDKFRAAGGIQCLIASMQNHVRSAALSEIALSCARFVVEDEQNQKIFGHDGGIEAITSILDEHRGHVGIAVKGCAAFRQLAYQRENRDLLGRCGGIRAIITAMMDTAASNGETATHLLKALSNSTYDSLANKTLAGRLGGIEAALNLLKLDTFKNERHVVEDACRVLRNLADGVLLNHRLLIKHKGISSVLDAARTHGKTCAGVAEHSVAIFVNLVANRAIAAQVQEGSGDLAAMAKSLMEAHPTEAKVSKQAKDLLNLLDSEENNGGNELASRSSGWKDVASMPSFERTLRSSKSLRRSSSREGEQLTRLQRLKSLPLPLSRSNR